MSPPSLSCRGQCVQSHSHVMTSMQADWAAAVKRWRYLRPTRSDSAATKVSLEIPSHASIDTPHTLIRGLWGRCTSPNRTGDISGRRGRTRPPMVSLEPPCTGTSKDTPHTLSRGPGRRQHHNDTPPQSHLNGRSYIYFPARLICLKRPPPWEDGRQRPLKATDTSMSTFSAFPPNWSVL